MAQRIVSKKILEEENTKIMATLKERAQAYIPTESWFGGDKVLWVIIAALSVISVLVVYSSTAKMAYDDSAIRSTSQFLQQQITMLIAGAALVLITHRINSSFFLKVTPLIFWTSLLLTFSVYFMGNSTNGAARWFSVMGFQFQPSEALKIATMLYLSRQLAMRQDIIDTLRIVPTYKIFTWSTPEQKAILGNGFRYILLPMLLACGVVAPAHTSSAVLLFGISMVILLIGRVQWSELRKIVVFILSVGAIFYFLGAGRADTAGGRVSTWIEIWTSDRTEMTVDELSDTERSMIAIYNGGMTGVGAGKSAMRVEMIHPESDYAYAFFVEEYGSLMAVALMLLYLWIFFRAITIFRECGTAFPALMVLGLALMITCQALLHIAVTVNVIPETGQTLPLISRGGSSLLFNAIALGMILSVSRQNFEHSHDAPKSHSLLEK